METGLLNFHDEETFATSIYDQGDFSGVDGQGSLLDMMHSDLQYSSDYLNQSAVHWDSDQEQEHNGDLAVLPVAPSECSSLNSSREEYNKSLFDWHDNLLPPLDPDGVDLRLDGQVIPSELPENIFEDSFESNSSVLSNLHKSSLSGPLARCSTPNQCPKETTVSSDGSLNLDVSLSALDVNVSDIDVSALGINVSSLDIKADGLDAEVKSLTPPVVLDQPEVSEIKLGTVAEAEDLVLPTNMPMVQTEASAVEDSEFAALFGPPEGPLPFQSNSEPNSLLPPFSDSENPQIPVPKMENADVEQLHDIAMEFIQEQQAAQAWDSLPMLDAPLDSNVDLDSINTEVPVLEAGNLESLLEQFEATLQPAPEFTQSMPASPAHFSVPPSPLSMPASPSCIMPSQVLHTVASKLSPLPSPLPSPSKSKSEACTPKKTSSPSKGVSVLHQNILESLPSEIMDRIKASGRKKTIPLIPAMPSKRPSKSSTRMHAAGATLSKNKLLKLVARKGSPGENIQLDHDYCSNDSSNHVEFVPEKLVMDIKASTRQKEVDDEKSSRKDSGLESGEDSEGTAISSASGAACDLGSIVPKANANSILKPRTPNQPGRNKEMLMVSVLKKVRCDTKSPAKQVSLLQQKPKEIPKRPPVQHVKQEPSSVLKPAEVLLKSVKSQVKRPLVQNVMPVKSTDVSSLLSQQLCCKASPKEISLAPVKPSETHVTSDKVQVKLEPQEVSGKCAAPVETLVVKAEVQVPVKLPEQPKKRKLNLEEYHNRQKAMEQKRDNSMPSDESKAESSVQGDQKPENLMEPSKSPLKVADVSNQQVVVKKETQKSDLPSQISQKASPTVVKVEKDVDSVPRPTLPNVNPTDNVKDEKNIEVGSNTVSTTQKETDVNPKPTEEKRKQRQYRTRRLSTSSSEESPQKKEINRSSRKENGRKSTVWSPPRSRSKSKSVSPSSSRSRSASSTSESCCSSSSDSSSSSSGSIKSSPKRRKTRQRRRKRTSDRSSSRSSSNSSRRSNSISSGSSRHSSRRSSRSRRRSRSRSMRRSRSRRDRSGSRSTSRGRGRRSISWRRMRRDSSRSRGSGSLRRSRSGSRARRRFNSYSSRSESRSRSRCWSSRSRSYSSSSRSSTRSRDRKRDERRRGERSVKKLRRSRSPVRRNVDWTRVEKEHNRQVEERRVIYVGRIPEDTTKAELRRRFEVFGPIVDISLHFREHADNYGFVTFAYKVDAYEAVERGNDDPTQPPYELCFGGRRKFCRERYADLDGMACNKTSISMGVPQLRRSSDGNSFDDMLREVQAKLQARKKL
ncbi:serine/arginine repetitive matrix protein 2 isoform X3 [Frankliniella occidentalis]|uniref:Serine/arginine repetitive matrix protein 2 isoform X3 n=1 Tax=Frankliniella occidentalis TaxID=133901 RepID=A0A9C6X289_FRAOC|nr:serine/arginine repetitive matrix protein 2 isoform X3 [Frankliniella occidentalis]